MTTLYRLPAIAPVAASDRESAASSNHLVATATSRYRNDPYKVNVRVPCVPADAAPLRSLISTNNAAGQVPAPPLLAAPTKLLRPTRHLLPALPRATSEIVEAPPADFAPEPQRVALIKYKRNFTSAFYNPREIQGLCAGNVIIVRGDRGEHIATVVNPNLARPKSTPTTVIRLATGEDLNQHQRVREDEAIALQTCKSHATRLGLDSLMEIVDVEFQLDFQKLTIFFRPWEEGQFVDFRNLQRALYQHFRCRIWIVDN